MPHLPGAASRARTISWAPIPRCRSCPRAPDDATAHARQRCACRHPPHAAAFARACSRGTAGTGATCRGARPTTRTTSSSPRSCCSRRRSIACCRSTTSGSRKFPSLAALADAPEADVTSTWRPLGYNIRPTRLQSIAREAVGRFGGQLPVRRSDAALVQGHRPVHRRRDPELRVRRTRRHPRHERRARAVPGVRRRRRSEEPRDEAAALARVGGARAAPARVRLQPGADGPGRDGLHGAQARGAPPARWPACAGPRDARDPLRDRRDRCSDRAGRALPADPPPRRHAPRRPLGVSRRQMRAGRDAPPGAGPRARRGARGADAVGAPRPVDDARVRRADGGAALLRGAAARHSRPAARAGDALGLARRAGARWISRKRTQPSSNCSAKGSRLRSGGER